MSTASRRDICDTSVFVRPLAIVIVSAAALVTYHAPGIERFGLRATDLGIEQCLAFLAFAWSLCNGSLLAWTNGKRPGMVPAFASLVADLGFLIGFFAVTVGQKSLFVPALLLVIVAAARARSGFVVVVATLAAIGGFLSLPAIQSALGRLPDTRSNADRFAILLLAIGSGLLVLRFATPPQTDSAARIRPSRILLFLSAGLPCLQMYFLDPVIGLLCVIPAAIVLRLALSTDFGIVSRSLGHTVAWTGAIGAFVASLVTVQTGILIADAFVPRTLEKLTRRFPELNQEWISWAATFVLVFLAIELARRAITTTSERNFSAES